MDDFDSPRRWSSSQPPEVKREHCVSVRMNPAELAMLDSRRAGFARGEYLRMCFLDAVPPIIPELNRQAWAELARAASNLNQLAKHANEGGNLDAEHLRQSLAAFRMALIQAGGDA